MDKLESLKTKFEAYGCSVEIAERTSQSLTPESKIENHIHKTLRINVPEERQYKTILISDQEDLVSIEKNELEKFRFLNGYKAIWSKDLCVIECQLEYDDQAFFFEDGYSILASIIDYKASHDEDQPEDQRKVLEFPTPKAGMRIFIGDCSIQYALLQKLQRQHYGRAKTNILTIRIEGVSINTHDEAVAALVKLSNTVLFQFDLVAHFPFRLALEIKYNFTSVRNHSVFFEDVKFSNPKFEYDEKPLALYMYARSSSEMPLLQYLAFYQVLEFYFPVYSLNEAQSKIKNFIKNPLFDANKDSDIAHIVNLIKPSAKGKSVGDERAQIKATVQGIVDQQSLSNFYHEYEERKNFFDQQKKTKGVAKQKINFSSENDARIDTALRIYEIRCRVVHAKDDENFELLLPYSKESMEMDLDIQLIEFLAQKAIIAGSRPLSI
jgi:hypothetical protein